MKDTTIMQNNGLVSPEILLTIVEKILYTTAKGFPSQSYPDHLEEVEGTSAEESFHSQRAKEQYFLALVRTGNTEEIQQIIEELKVNGFPASILSPMLEKNIDDLMVTVSTCITLCCREAIDAGVPEILAFSINDAYFALSRKVVHNRFYLGLLCFLPGLTFANAVEDWVIKNQNPAIRLCYAYIMSHLEDPISLDDLSKACNLSSNYVSDLFKKELGVRPIMFIRNMKLKASCFSLLNTNSSISTVASRYSFPSASAFTSQFRELYGVTPLQFRKNPKTVLDQADNSLHNIKI